MYPQQPGNQGQRYQVHYTGYQDQRRPHEVWCKSPHPYAVVECTCPASASLDYRTPLNTMSADQYDMLYKPAPMPVHKLKAIRHKRHMMRPKDQKYWPKNPQTGEPQNPQEYGYPDDWLDGPIGKQEEYDLFDPNTGAPVVDYSPPQYRQEAEQHYQENREIIEARKTAPNFWEVDQPNQEEGTNAVSPEDAERWHHDPNFQEQEYTTDQLARAQRRAGYTVPPPPPPAPITPTIPHPEYPSIPVPAHAVTDQYGRPVPQSPSQPPQAVYPTQYAGLPPVQQQQMYPANGQPMIPHTQQMCRAAVSVDIPGSLVAVVVICEVEREHPNQPHMTPIKAYGGKIRAFIMWRED